MDPITIGTTVSSLVTTFTKRAQTCNALLSKYKHAPQTLASIHTECTTIKLALSHVYWLVNSNTELLSSQLVAQGPLAETFDVALTGCTVTFSLLDIELQKLCQQSKDNDTYSAKEKIKFLWNEDLARSLLDDMRGLQGAVTLLLTALQTTSLAALNLTIAQQRPVIERVRQSTNSVCQGFRKNSQVRNGSFDTYSIFSSAIGDEEFAFDNEVINTQVYRRVLNMASKAQVLENADPNHEPELFDEPLIDLSDEPKAASVPSLDNSRAGSRWFGSFDGVLPAELPGDLAFVGSGNDTVQDPTSLGDTSFTQSSGNVPLIVGGPARRTSNDQLQADNDSDPLPPTINMQSVPLAEIERSGSESHHFILSALVWLVDPDSYTINDSVVSNSISETRVLILGPICGKTSACKTYAAQNSKIMGMDAITIGLDSHKIRVPIIINRSGFTQESIVTLIDTGQLFHEREDWALFKMIHSIIHSSDADVVVLCYPVSDGWIQDVNEYWFPRIREHCPEVPVILVGMMTDIRDTTRSGDHHFYRGPASSYDEGLACAKINNTAAYVECSSTNLQSINQMFETAIRLALASKLKVQQIQSPRLKRGLSLWWKGYKARQSTSSQGST